MAEKQTDLWIIGGFLGSGKTTALNALLSGMSERRLGVLVNDFGTLGVDVNLVHGSGDEEIVELNGGQIFCACISGSFVKSMKALSDHDLDAILVESSGLAKPNALGDIIDETVKLSGGKIRYRGFVSIVDAQRFPKLLGSVNAVEEQIVYADLVVVNKTDLVNGKDLQAVRDSIRSINDKPPVIETVQGAIDPAELPPEPLDRSSDTFQLFAGWDGGGRPVTAEWRPDRLLDESELRSILEKASEKALRIKGFLKTREGLRSVSVTGAQFSITPAKEPAQENAAGKTHDKKPKEGLSVILPNGTDVDTIFSLQEKTR
ncbi:MAG: GTP-binding protein [Spirochaetales bacterium]|nr:GTP-binding protein [Spirochaetales bacterium]MCF7937695.1 GTP-binding protein [Spirochaetales bacterium]